ncbi:MAG: phosphotransferase family protein [Halieaceae bacterium]|nr:phosphotransferase family protein [Halieaceae bacterium]
MESEILLRVQLIRTVLSALRNDIRPELQSQQALHRADLAEMMLARLAADTEYLTLAPQENTPDESAVKITAQVINTLRDDSSGLGPRQGELLAEEIALFAADDQRQRSDREKRLAEVAKHDTQELHSAKELSIPDQVYSDYLGPRIAAQQGVAPADFSLSEVNIVPGGRSKGTILVTYNVNGQQQSLVIRRDFSASVTGVPVTYEYPIIEAVFRAGLPVPEPLWLEQDAAVLGGAFIVVKRAPGTTMGTLFHSNASPEFARQFAATLARVHSVDLPRAGLLEHLNWGSEQNPVRAMVDHFYQRYRERLSPVALLDAAFAWLYLQLDSLGLRRSLVHGDAGFHNTLGQGDVLTSLLDWEFAHAGDPAEDLAYCKHLVETVLPWEEFMQAYQAAGGEQIAEGRMRFFTIWRTVQLAIQMGGARSMFESGADQDLRIAVIGFNSYPRILAQLANDLAAC